MIAAGTYPPLLSTWARVILQREYREGDYRVWRDVLVDGETVKSPVDLDVLPVGKYRLV